MSACVALCNALAVLESGSAAQSVRRRAKPVDAFGPDVRKLIRLDGRHFEHLGGLQAEIAVHVSHLIAITAYSCAKWGFSACDLLYALSWEGAWRRLYGTWITGRSLPH